jgi:phenylacetate-CoA ligase
LKPSQESLEQLLAFREIVDEAKARARLEQGLAELRSQLFASPYYRKTLGALGLSPRDLSSLDDLRAFPLLDRPTLGKEWRDLPNLDSADPRCRDAVVIRSSGSTGAPIRVLRDGYELLHMWTVLRFWAQILGISLPPSPKVVLLCTLPGGLEYTSSLPLLDDGTLIRVSTKKPDPLRRLLDAAPQVIFSDPAGLHWLTAQSQQPSPLLTLTSAQLFSPALRQALAEVNRAPVVNYYATSETGPLAWECLEAPGRFHLLHPEVWVESVDGELVVTRLRSSLLPLLRYRTGDAGAVKFGRCSCGHRGWTITGFTGRRACELQTPSGELVDAWQLAFLFKHHPLEDFRLTQTDLSSFELEVVTDASDLRDLSDTLVAALKVMGWPDPKVQARKQRSPFSRELKPEPFRNRFFSAQRAL